MLTLFSRRSTGWGLISLSFILALILMIIPLPYWAESFRPLWLLLVTVYWTSVLPHKVNITIAWLNGLVLDLLQGTLLGENALCFIVAAYIIYIFHRRFRLLSVFLQGIFIFVLLLLNQILIFWLQGLQGQFVTLKWFLGSALTSAIFWPWINYILTNLTQRYRLH